MCLNIMHERDDLVEELLFVWNGWFDTGVVMVNILMRSRHVWSFPSE